jgi:hypothetical protein
MVGHGWTWQQINEILYLHLPHEKKKEHRLIHGFKKVGDVHLQEFGDFVKFGDRWLGMISDPFRNGLLTYTNVTGKRLVLDTLHGKHNFYSVVYLPFLHHHTKIQKKLKVWIVRNVLKS